MYFFWSRLFSPMAEKFKLLSLLWLLIACFAQTHSTTTSNITMPISENSSMTTAPPPISTTAATIISTTAAPTISTTAAPTISTTTPPIISTTAAPIISTTAAPTISTTAPPTISTTAAPTISTTAAPTISTTAAPNISTTAPPIISTTAPPTISTTAAPTISTTAPPTISTTAAPTISTTAPPTISTTAAPTISTTAPPTISTTAAPTISTTAAPTISTTAAPPPTILTTTTPPSDNSTLTTSPSDNSTITLPPSDNSTTSTPPPTETTGPCVLNPCGQGSTCDAYGNHSFLCLCLPGDNYNYERKSCENAQIFPGQLALRDIVYKTGMETKGSPAFIEAVTNITTKLTRVFDSTEGFSNVTVLELKKLVPTRDASESELGVDATVNIIFFANSGIETSDVIKALNKSGLEFTNKSLCVDEPCDIKTTECGYQNGMFNCTCDKNYIKSNFTDRICIACASGTYASVSKCDKCPFGYTGLNCEEHWQLALIIVACVLGGVLLICLILLPVLFCRSSKKSSKKKNQNVDLGKPYVSHSPAKSPLVYSNSYLENSQQSSQSGLVYGKGGAPEIPRAKATSIWDRTTNLELPSRNRQNMDKESNHFFDDDMNSQAQSRPQSEHSAFVRPRNPYVQNRPPVNPYSQSQGYNNPSFVQDNGRFRN